MRDAQIQSALTSHFGIKAPCAKVAQIAKCIATATGWEIPPRKQQKEFLRRYAVEKALYVPDKIAAKTIRKLKRGTGTPFLMSDAWREVRYRVLKLHGARCQCCGATRSDGVCIHVDHIKPRSKYPDLSLDITNLQVLCENCNIGKRAWDETDWREPLRIVADSTKEVA